MADVDKILVRNANLFELLSNKLACLVYSRTDGDKEMLNKILDDLNSLDFNSHCVKNNDRAVLVINQCCFLISAEETSLTLKACSLFVNLITKQQIIIEGKTLSLAILWCLEQLKHEVNIHVLKCLQVLVQSNGKKIEEQCPQLINKIEELALKAFSNGEEDIYLACLKCIESLVHPSGVENDHLPHHVTQLALKIFKEILYRECKPKNEINHCKCLITSMRGVGNALQQLPDVDIDHLNDILGIVKGYMLYGLPGHDAYKVEKVFSSKVPIPEVLKIVSPNTKKLKGKYDRKSKKVPVTAISTVEESEDVSFGNKYVAYSENFQQNATPASTTFKTSDSDYSDSELNKNYKVRSQQTKVRHCALILLGTVISKVDPKLFTGYLPCFLPDGLQVPHTRTLITCLLKDSSPNCRSEVLGILSTLLSNSKQHLSLADSISKPSFTSFASGIAYMIKELHRCLIFALIAENSSAVITRTLKCISDLIRCSPYHKLEPGLVSKVSRHVRGYLKHKDVNVRIAALTVFGCIVSVEPKIQEVKEVITKSISEETMPNDAKNPEEEISQNFDENLDFFEEEESENTTVKPWLFESCLRNLTDQSEDSFKTNGTNIALVIESLQVIGALVRNFLSETVLSFPNDVLYMLEYCSKKSEYSIRLYSGKFLETVLNSLQFSLTVEDETKRASVSLVTSLWESLLKGPISSLMQSQDEPMLRSTGCDCIANIGVQVNNGQTWSIQNSLIFDQLSRDKQILCITHLFGGIRDESPAVRSSAARALAIFVLFPALRDDSLFLLDAVDSTIAVSADNHASVRSQAAWLLGNLTEAIVLNKQQGIDDGVSDEVVLKLLKTGIALSRDIPKIKPGAVRGVGNLLKIVTEEYIKKYKDSVVEGLDVLLKNATTGTFMKARWNSCYAIANALQNSYVHNNSEWVSKIFGTMINLVQNYKNFKVRISAGCVLSVPPSRSSYGDQYYLIWSSTLNALENSKNVSDFNEFQHRDQLVDQLCLTMCHLISVITADDLNSLQDILVFHIDNLEHYVKRFQERIVPEKSNVILNATTHINELMDLKNINAEQKSALSLLNNIFANDR